MPPPDGQDRTRRQQRLLILGGSWFLGRTLAEAALAQGWQVTCFNRGRTGRDSPGVQSVRGDRTDPSDVERLAGHGAWDVVVDTSAYEPADAALAARVLRPVARRYVLVSTVAVHRHWSLDSVDESSPLRPSQPEARTSDADIAAMPRSHAYGTLKAGCEQAVQETFGDDALILRPGVILGPHEYVGRLPTLLGRAARGGKMLAAGDPAQPWTRTGWPGGTFVSSRRSRCGARFLACGQSTRPAPVRRGWCAVRCGRRSSTRGGGCRSSSRCRTNGRPSMAWTRRRRSACWPSGSASKPCADGKTHPTSSPDAESALSTLVFAATSQVGQRG